MAGTQAVDRTAALFLHVLRAKRPVTFAELSQTAGLAKSTTSRLLSALEQHGLLSRDGAGAFLPGPAIDSYARAADGAPALAHRVRPALLRVVAATGETANLAVGNGRTVDLVDQVDGTFMLGTLNWVGRLVPAHASALGKVLLAFGRLDPSAMPLTRLTRHTITERDVLARELDGVRRHGHAVIRDELEIGLAAVAVPVYEADLVVAAVSLSGPTGRLDDDRIHVLAAALRTEFRTPRQSRASAPWQESA